MNALKLLTLVLFPFCYALNAQNIHPKLDSVLRKKLSDQHLSLNVKGLSAAIQFADGRVWAGSVVWWIAQRDDRLVGSDREALDMAHFVDIGGR